MEQANRGTAAGPAAEEFSPVRAALRDGRSVTIRAIRPDDADAMRAAFERLSAEARYARFMTPLRELNPALLRRAVQPAAGDRALVAVVAEGAGEVVVGGARYLKTADDGTCEFAVTIVDDWPGVGLAGRLMRELTRDAGARGLRRMEGFVLASNRPMLDLARRLGFEIGASQEGPSVKLVWLALGKGAPETTEHSGNA
jgi:RimJ/RimL family protein N-acetyltransferase